jgi:hypothetical protein
VTNRVPQLDRRGALRVAALAAVAAPVLAACDATEVTPRNGAVRQSGHSSAADVALVRTVGKQINDALHVAARNATATPAARRWAHDLVTLHRAHLKRLGVAVRTGPNTGGPIPHEAIKASETRLQSHLVAAAQQAESGVLAQVLASMAAAIGQRLVTA